MITLGKDLAYEDNHQHFETLLEKTKEVLMDQNKQKPFLSHKNLWSQFEQASFDAILQVQKENHAEPFASWGIELVSGGKFPDITAEIAQNLKFGVEVKTTQSKSWKTLGGSIMEGTRVKNVERINVFFARLDPFQIQTKRFEDCVSDVAVTHSPRYLIDFEVSPEQTIFKKIKTSYQEIWNSEKPFEHFRKYFEEKAKKDGNGLWFISSQENEAEVENYPSLEIKFFSDLPKEEKELISSKAMLLFPEIFGSRANFAYKEVALWLLKMGIMNTSLRDMFSAGSKVNLFGVKVSSKFERLFNQLHLIQYHLKLTPLDIDISLAYQSTDAEEVLNKWKIKVLDAVKYDLNLRSCVVEIFRHF